MTQYILGITELVLTIAVWWHAHWTVALLLSWFVLRRIAAAVVEVLKEHGVVK